MRSAAGLQVRSLNLDGAQNPLPLDFLAHAQFRELLRGAVAHVDRPVVENHLIRGTLRAFQNLFRRFGTAQIDGADFAAEMERNGGPPESLLEHRREQVLPGVLLHVIEAAGPVDTALNIAESNSRSTMCSISSPASRTSRTLASPILP